MKVEALTSPTPIYLTKKPARFLSSVPAPVYVGLGSISGHHRERTTAIVVEVVRGTDVKAVPSRGWRGLDIDGFELPDSILAIEFTPHEWLFPRVAAAVHHGGCGTTAISLRAGRPTILCPYFGGRSFWSK